MLYEVITIGELAADYAGCCVAAVYRITLVYFSIPKMPKQKCSGFFSFVTKITPKIIKIVVDNYIGKRYNSITVSDISYNVTNFEFGVKNNAGKQRKSVITSYSIHYTKLYDMILTIEIGYRIGIYNRGKPDKAHPRFRRTCRRSRGPRTYRAPCPR